MTEKNESLKMEITNYLTEGRDKEVINKKINLSYEKIIKEINENSNLNNYKNKNEDEIANLLVDLIKIIKTK